MRLRLVMKGAIRSTRPDTGYEITYENDNISEDCVEDYG
jgi:hypothetical protein